MAFCLDREDARLISPDNAQLIDSDEELSHLIGGGLYRTSGYWSIDGKFWFDAAANDAAIDRNMASLPYSPVSQWGAHIEPRLCIANGQKMRRFDFSNLAIFQGSGSQPFLVGGTLNIRKKLAAHLNLENF